MEIEKMQWDVIEKKEVLKTVPFTVEELHLKFKSKDGPKHLYHRINCPDWVNVLPVTREGKAILIRQSRAGNMKNVLEIPGGVIDAHEKDPTMAAIRELEEETGYTTQRILPLAVINPNPAINTNRLHMFIALNCAPATQRQHFADENEEIEVLLTDTADLDQMIRTGQIDSCLSCLTIMLGQQYLINKPVKV